MTQSNERHDQPNIMSIIDWLRGREDPGDCLAIATALIDQVRTDLLPELAAVRRQRAYQARSKLVSAGMSVAEANLTLAKQVGASPQTIMRLITEKGAYGE